MENTEKNETAAEEFESAEAEGVVITDPETRAVEDVEEEDPILQLLFDRIDSDSSLTPEEKTELKAGLRERVESDQSEDDHIDYYEDGAWEEIKKAVLEGLGRRGVFSSMTDARPSLKYTIRYQGSVTHIQVVYEPQANAIQIRASFPFYVCDETMVLAKSYACQKTRSWRFTKLELDESDGEVLVTHVCYWPHRDHAPEYIEHLIDLVENTALGCCDELRRYSLANLDRVEEDEVRNTVKDLENFYSLLRDESSSRPTGSVSND
ncbi:MAG TPA: hypothetical protein IAA69_01035 [Candidatus Aveggerthella stercoripullorum]|uniref:Uncharacterized protein n=1 Tax=Candidatus Aveggerthella stercoripullorum TaxID=2840688 RepID=A0A9D0ZZ86_9ACTN|nr:hypothetical protein [Candidatus Aveggerthella stercoripullorum]